MIILAIYKIGCNLTTHLINTHILDVFNNLKESLKKTVLRKDLKRSSFKIDVI